jgi:MFS family permease
MVKGFQGGDDTNASFYAGLLVSAFAVAEACTAMTWGTISDRYGRKPVILIGLAGTALSSLVFGFATNFWVALGARVIGGLLNGNVAVMQTMVAEMCKKPEWERRSTNLYMTAPEVTDFGSARAYAMPPFMWSLGLIIGAAMGGFLAQPARYYPSVFPPDGLFGKYPYLLPNLVAVGFILVAIIQGYFFLEETNPRFQSRSRHTEDNDSGPVDEYTPLQPGARRKSAVEILSTGPRRPSFISGSMPTMSEPSFNLRKGSVTTIYEITPVVPASERGPDDDESDPPIKAFNRSVILWTVALVIMCYHQMAFASVLPIYLLDEPQKSSSVSLRGGLGYTVHDVGAFMSINGVIALFIQATIFPVFVGRVGVWKSLASLLILCPITYIIVPFLSLLPRSGLPIGIYAVLTLENFFLIIIYPCLLIALKNATPSSLVLGKVNGLAMSASSGARTIAPPLVGIIYGAGGSAAAWWSIAAVAVVGALELCLIGRPKDDADVVVENVLRRKSTVEQSIGRLQEEEEG